MHPDHSSPGARGRIWGVAALILVVALVVFVRLRLLQVPLERDEGEFAYGGQLMLQGVPPYAEAYYMKLPGTYAAYALMMALFGQTVSGIHFGFLLVNLVALALLFLLARRLAGFWGGLVAVTTYGLLSLSQGDLGLEAHATHLVALCALGGLWLLLRARENAGGRPAFWSGICFGLAFLCKQPALCFGMFGLVALALDASRNWPFPWKSFFLRASLYSAGFLLPFALTCLLLGLLGSFQSFWFWTITYASMHAGVFSMDMARQRLTQFFAESGALPWCLVPAGAGLACLILQKDDQGRRPLLLALLFFSIMAFSAAFYFNKHYFLAMLPVVSLLSAVGVTETTAALRKTSWPLLRLAPAALFVAGCVGFAALQAADWFELTPAQVCRAAYLGNPFPESIQIAKYIHDHSGTDDRIALFGSEPEIFFYAHRRSASAFINMFDLVQQQPYAAQMQKEMEKEVHEASPKFLVLVNIETSWRVWPPGDPAIRQWSWQFARQLYDLTGGVAYIGPTNSEYIWDSGLAAKNPPPPLQIYVFKRK